MIQSCRSTGNHASRGAAPTSATKTNEAHLTIHYIKVEGGLAGVFVESGSSHWWGDGMIDADQLFASDELGDYFLIRDILR